MDHVVCVSQAQAVKARRAGVRADQMSVIYNAIDPSRFAEPDERYRAKLQRYFRQPRTHLVGAAGRLSPEKGFEVLVTAAERVRDTHPSAGFVLFGDGPERARLQQQINAAGLSQTFILGGFRADLDRFLPHFDLLVLPSYTEGLPNIVLESFAAGVPVIATAVGGTPEVIEEGVSGHLVPPGHADALARRIGEALSCSGSTARHGPQGPDVCTGEIRLRHSGAIVRRVVCPTVSRREEGIWRDGSRNRMPHEISDNADDLRRRRLSRNGIDMQPLTRTRQAVARRASHPGSWGDAARPSSHHGRCACAS